MALGIIDLATGLELSVMALCLVGFGSWTIGRALSGNGRALTAGLVSGGALGNLADRALFGSVRDFMATPWFVFHLADVALLVGVALLYIDKWGRRYSVPSGLPRLWIANDRWNTLRHAHPASQDRADAAKTI